MCREVVDQYRGFGGVNHIQFCSFKITSWKKISNTILFLSWVYKYSTTIYSIVRESRVMGFLCDEGLSTYAKHKIKLLFSI